MHVYLDSAPIIYLIENISPYSASLASYLAKPNTEQFCSHLTRLECRVKPLRDNEPALLTAFDRYFTEIISAVIPISQQVIDEATQLRAKYGFRTPDAIHLAAAIVSGCDRFLTNDYRLAQCKEIQVDVLSA